MTDEKTLDDVVQMLQGERIAMLTSLDGGQLVSRPMGVQRVDADATLWFFVETDADKSEQVEQNPQVNATFAGDDYLSVSGTAQILQDPELATELWNSFAEAWLKCEPTDAKVSLLKVTPETIGYWETPSSARFLLGVAKSKLGGSRPQGGESGVVDVDDAARAQAREAQA